MKKPWSLNWKGSWRHSYVYILSQFCLWQSASWDTTFVFKRDSRTFATKQPFSSGRGHSAMRMLGDRHHEGMTPLPRRPCSLAQLLPLRTRLEALPQLLFPTHANHSNLIPFPGLWEEMEGIGWGLALNVSRKHKVGRETETVSRYAPGKWGENVMRPL